MKRVQRILAHPLYQEYAARILQYEKNRKFCGHGMDHFLDVAQIAMQMNLKENKKPIPKELIYGAALLHDIGRFEQYESGRDHAEASAALAPEILKDCGYSKEEIRLIVEAIKSHRKQEVKNSSDLKGILYRADKLSRPCYDCPAASECNWKEKNHEDWRKRI